MLFNKLKIISLISVACFSTVLIILLVIKTINNSSENSFASQSVDVVSTKQDWEINGSIAINIDTISSEGSILIDNKLESQLDLEVLYNEDNSRLYATVMPDLAPFAFDGDTGTSWNFSYPPEEEPDEDYWLFDLSETKNIVQIRFYCDPPPQNGFLYCETSSDGINYTERDVSPFWDWTELDYEPSIDVRYIRFRFVPTLPSETFFTTDLNEVELTSSAQATHTTAATQIDGQEGSADKTLIEWTSFTPTQTTPVNTSISYEFRTSANGSDWTAWSAPQTYSGSPLDLTGLTASRYLQIKATLTTTDAGATPQIDDYTIDFHNNQKPNQPIAQTAIIGN